MKGRKLCYGLLLVCSIIFGSLLNDYSDTSAVGFSMDVEPTGVEWAKGDVDCTYSSGDNWVSTTGSTNQKWACTNPPSNWSGDIYQIRTHSQRPVQEGYYYQIQFVLRNSSRSVRVPGPMFWNFSTTAGFQVIDVEMSYQKDRDVWETCQFTYGSQGQQIASTTCEEYLQTYNVILNIWVRATETINRRFILGTSDSVFIRGNFDIAQPSDYGYTAGIARITEFKPSGASAMNEKDDEDRSNIESQSSTIDSDASDSASDAETTGTTLLGAFSGFITALTSTQPGNCVLDMDLGNLDLGNVDFCTLSPPAGFSAIASVFMILFCVPLSISTARKIISLFRSFQ